MKIEKKFYLVNVKQFDLLMFAILFIIFGIISFIWMYLWSMAVAVFLFFGLIYTITHQIAIGVDKTNSVHIPCLPSWRKTVSDNSVRFLPRTFTDEGYMEAKLFQFRFNINNIAEIKKVDSFSDQENNFPKPRNEVEQSQSIIRRLYMEGNKGVMIKIKELNPESYLSKKPSIFADKEYFNKQNWQNIVIYLGLEKPDEFIQYIKTKREQYN